MVMEHSKSASAQARRLKADCGFTHAETLLSRRAPRCGIIRFMVGPFGSSTLFASSSRTDLRLTHTYLGELCVSRTQPMVLWIVTLVVPSRSSSPNPHSRTGATCTLYPMEIASRSDIAVPANAIADTARATVNAWRTVTCFISGSSHLDCALVRPITTG